MTPASNLSRVAVTLTGASSGTTCLPYSVAPHTLTCVLLVPARVQGVLDLSIAVGVAAAFDLGQVNVLAADPPGVFAALPACCVMGGLLGTILDLYLGKDFSVQSTGSSASALFTPF